jgi:hypothetical protein
MLKRWRWAVMLVLAFTVQACGGGGDNAPAGTPACVWDSTNWDGCNWQ